MNLNVLERLLQSHHPSKNSIYLHLSSISLHPHRDSSCRICFIRRFSITAGHGHNGYPLPWNDWASFLVNTGQRIHRSGFRGGFRSMEKAMMISRANFYSTDICGLFCNLSSCGQWSGTQNRPSFLWRTTSSHTLLCRGAACRTTHHDQDFDF